MKTKFFAVLFFVLPAVALAKAGFNPTFDLPSVTFVKEDSMKKISVPTFAKATAGKGADPLDFKVVISQKRIWFVADEMPMKCLKTHIKNSEGKIVLEKCFSSKCAEWFLNIEALPKGEYTLHLGADHVEKFKR